MKIFNIKKCLITGFVFFLSAISVLAESASLDFSLTLNKYLRIETVTSPVLIANVTDATGNLYTPLYGKFKVVSNAEEDQELFLQAHALTKNGMENAMFEMNGRVYLAFTNVKDNPSSQALANCKMGSHPMESPGVVAYPITSIRGVKAQYLGGKNKYKMFVEKGITNITVNVGSHVLQNSFASNDPMGFYQATLMLTEADI